MFFQEMQIFLVASMEIPQDSPVREALCRGVMLRIYLFGVQRRSVGFGMPFAGERFAS